MIWTGKIILGGLGYLIFHLPGLVIGLFLGHQIDRKAQLLRSYNPFQQMGTEEREALNEALFEALFSVLGHLAKADGSVSREEVAQAEALMTRMALTGAKRQQAIAFFQAGKAADFPLDEVVAKFRQRIQGRKVFVLNFIEILLSAALADGSLHAEEERILTRVAQGLGIPESQFRQLLAMLLAQQRFTRAGGGAYQGGQQGYHQPGAAGRQGPTLAEAYSVLGVTSEASNADVKKTYRRLMSQHHPDKLAAQGLGAEAIRVATEKTAQISRAYDMIKQNRGFK